MALESGIVQAAELFKILGNPSRLELLCAIERTPLAVGALAEVTGLSQPLTSQHLRTLRQANLVTAERQGKEVIYRIADLHVSHVIADALIHVLEADAAEATVTPSAEGNDHDHH
ncbi:ArsR/SmtB family transcription factor [Corynebacterium alimapuense]|uniref:Transcriptional regulator n=1 Tax=Corynebacterium alimapuense TaxID=1576874 RepID=A0A3M8K8X2_9CORY|nr:metalloregulator ArsR/SmtB family transcription factor [Corynebacterium alimapuense]RNE49677.1 transcriptional regulator [Corynebacterium alimapuense]